MLQRKSDRERYDYSQGPRRRAKRSAGLSRIRLSDYKDIRIIYRYITERGKLFRAASRCKTKEPEKAGNRYQARPPPGSSALCSGKY